MKTFKEHMSEETNPFALSNGFVGVEDEKARDNINALLNGITMKPFLTPYIALERVGKVLANYHIFLPKHTFEDIDEDSVAFEVNQFGEKFGMTNDGQVVTKMANPYFIYFEYNQNEQGTYDVFCEIVDSDDLEELMSGEEELDESVQIQEVSKKLAKSYIKEAGNLGSGMKKLKFWYKGTGPEGTGDPRPMKQRLKNDPEHAKRMASHEGKLGGMAELQRRMAKRMTQKEETQLDELSKKKLGKYIKAASHDVAARSAAVRGFARDADDERKDKRPMDARRSDERADKMFKKSWNRRKYMAKAVDKLTSEEKSVMPAWYEKEKSKSASLQAMTDAKKKEQKKKIDSAVRRLKEENSESGPENRKMERDQNIVNKSQKTLDLMKAIPGPTDNVPKITAIRDMAQRRITQNKAVNTETGFRGTIGSQDMYTSWGKEPVNMKKARTQAGIEEEQSADTHTGALKYNGKPVVSPTATTVQPDFPPKKIPVPKPRPKNLEEMNPAKAGAIAAGYKGSNPAEQGSIAVMKDDEARDRKANFKVAKKLAKDAKKTAMKKAMEKKSSK